MIINPIIFRNNSKKESLTIVHLVVLVVKISFDSVSRILLFSSWLYVTNDGQFDTWTVTIAYYTVVGLMFSFNLIFHKNTKKDLKNKSNKKSLISITGIVMNSFSSTLTYNNFDFVSMLTKKQNKKHLHEHEPTFLKELFYLLIFLVINIV